MASYSSAEPGSIAAPVRSNAALAAASSRAPSSVSPRSLLVALAEREHACAVEARGAEVRRRIPGGEQPVELAPTLVEVALAHPEVDQPALPERHLGLVPLDQLVEGRVELVVPALELVRRKREKLHQRRRISAAPATSSAKPTKRGQVRPTRSTPKNPKRSMTAALTRLPAITVATVAVTPIRGGPTVTAKTMKTLITPPSQSQAGSWKAARTPAKLRSQASSAASPQASETSTESATAGTIPTRSPSSPITAA